jgi:hypothetical protein
MRHLSFLLLPLVLVACGDAPPVVDDTPPAPPAVTTEVAVVATSQQSSWEEVLEVMVTTTEDWAAAWNHLHDGVSPPPPMPEVDFTTQRVMIVTAGSRPNGGFTLTHERTEVVGDTLVLDVTLGVPGASCMTTMALTSPALALAVPLVPAAVVVRRAEQVRECEP